MHTSNVMYSTCIRILISSRFFGFEKEVKEQQKEREKKTNK